MKQRILMVIFCAASASCVSARAQGVGSVMADTNGVIRTPAKLETRIVQIETNAMAYATTQAVAAAIAPLATTQQLAQVEALIPDVSGFATTQQVASAVETLATTQQLAQVEALIPNVSVLATTQSVALAVAPLATTQQLAQVEATLGPRIALIEGLTNDWSTAFLWGDHAQAGYLLPEVWQSWMATNTYVKIEDDPVASENLMAHIADTNNPHSVSPYQIGAATTQDLSIVRDAIPTNYVVAVLTNGTYKFYLVTP